MRAWAVCLLVCIAVGCASGQAGTVDEFTEEQSLVLVSSADTPSIYFSSAVTAPDILGGYRAIQFYVYCDQSNDVFSVAALNGQLLASYPSAPIASGGVWVTWNGETYSNQGPLNINATGLGGLDLKAEGYNMFTTRMRSDIPASASLSVFSTNMEDYCKVDFPIPVDVSMVDISLPFSDFELVGQGCDFSSVGAIQFYAPAVPNMDWSMDYLRLDNDGSGGDADECRVSMYTGGDQCKALDPLACSSCSVGAVESFYRYNCTATAADGCQCYQYLYGSQGCTGTPLITQVPSQPCAQLAGSFSEGSVCYATVEAAHSYQVNFFRSDPGVSEAQCQRVEEETCVACTAGGESNYYSASCDADATDGYPCVLEIYTSSDATCSEDAVRLPMLELTCAEMSAMYEGDAVCAFSFEQR